MYFMYHRGCLVPVERHETPRDQGSLVVLRQLIQLLWAHVWGTRTPWGVKSLSRTYKSSLHTNDIDRSPPHMRPMLIHFSLVVVQLSQQLNITRSGLCLTLASNRLKLENTCFFPLSRLCGHAYIIHMSEGDSLLASIHSTADCAKFCILKWLPSHEEFLNDSWLLCTNNLKLNESQTLIDTARLTKTKGHFLCFQDDDRASRNAWRMRSSSTSPMTKEEHCWKLMPNWFSCDSCSHIPVERKKLCLIRCFDSSQSKKKQREGKQVDQDGEKIRRNATFSSSNNRQDEDERTYHIGTWLWDFFCHLEPSVANCH